MSELTPNEFEKAAVEQKGGGNIFIELWGLLRENKKWWMLPILVVLLIFGLLLLLGGTGLAPFIYTLF